MTRKGHVESRTAELFDAVLLRPFVLDSEARELLRDGEAVHLSPKAYQLLEALVENRPKALSKSALHDLLWPNTFVVQPTWRTSWSRFEA